MSTDSQLTVLDLPIQVVRKDIKNLHVAVYPPDGRVRVAAPAHMDDDSIRLAVVDRLAWIRRQRRELLAQPRQSEREMVDGETHFVWGRRYRLAVVEDGARPSVTFGPRNTLRLTVRPGTDRDGREHALTEWYRAELRRETADRIDEWADQLDVEVAEWRLRRMRTKWGSCNPEDRRIWLNLELAKKPHRCLDYVIVHELAHLRERTHNAEYERIIEQAMPDWRGRRDELYDLPLSHEDWPAR